MKLDENMRSRVRALAALEPLSGLDAAGRARAELAARRRAELSARRRAWAVGVLAAAGLAAAGLLAFPGSHAPAGPIGSARSLPAPPVVVAQRACPEHAAATWQTTEQLTQRLDLGTRALLVAAPGARIAHDLSAACDVRARLTAGSVAVHARALRGAELVVHTPYASVLVKGTIFEVTLSDTQQLRVAVDEGRVEVRTAHEVLQVDPGQLLILGERVTRMPLAPAARAALRGRLGLLSRPSVPPLRSPLPEPVREPAAEPAPDSVVEERAWHSGALPAPQLAPDRGARLDEQGRPLSKPRYVTPKSGAEP
jgi:hypothetical protein